MSGTHWVAPGEGATVHELDIAVHGKGINISGERFDRTNLRLTGDPLTENDLNRVRNITVTKDPFKEWIRDALTELKLFSEECDHDVGICYCSLHRLLEQGEELIK